MSHGLGVAEHVDVGGFEGVATLAAVMLVAVLVHRDHRALVQGTVVLVDDDVHALVAQLADGVGGGDVPPLESGVSAAACPASPTARAAEPGRPG